MAGKNRSTAQKPKAKALEEAERHIAEVNYLLGAQRTLLEFLMDNIQDTEKSDNIYRASACVVERATREIERAETIVYRMRRAAEEVGHA